MDQDQLNPYVAYEGYVVRVPHNPLKVLRLIARLKKFKSRIRAKLMPRGTIELARLDCYPTLNQSG